MSAIRRSPGSFRPYLAMIDSNEQRPSTCPSSAPSTSKGSAPCSRATRETSPSSTYRNSAPGSMSRRISHGHAIRSTAAFFRVTHFISATAQAIPGGVISEHGSARVFRDDLPAGRESLRHLPAGDSPRTDATRFSPPHHAKHQHRRTLLGNLGDPVDVGISARVPDAVEASEVKQQSVTRTNANLGETSDIPDNESR